MKALGLRGLGLLSVTEMGASIGRPPFDFDLDLIAFTAGMAKRAGNGPFAGAPIVQGHWDGSGIPDVMHFPRGQPIGNPTKDLRANFDLQQGSILFWITPEWGGGDGITHSIIVSTPADGRFLVRKLGTNLVIEPGAPGAASVTVDISAWVAGSTHYIVGRWDSKRTLDGVNHACLSIDDVHTFGITSSWDAVGIATLTYIGSYGGTLQPANAIIEGLTVYRRLLWDEDYGVDIGNGDEIAQIFAAGVGVDPCLITKGSWDIPFCLPTDSTVGPIVTGPGEAWSHPLESGSLGANMLADDGGYLSGPYAVLFNGTTTIINCGSDVDIDDAPDGANGFQAEAWIRPDGWGEGSQGRIMLKAGWDMRTRDISGGVIQAEIVNATTNSESQVAFTLDAKWHHVLISFEHIDQGGDSIIYIAIDGRWAASYVTQITGNGAYVSDAANDLAIGNSPAALRTFDGAIGWCAISNNMRRTVGTDFIAPRDFPADDANYLASWPMNEGTGVAIDNIGNQGGAGSGAANRDGVLANGAWEAQWDQDTSPVIPHSVTFNAVDTGGVVTDAAAIQDLHAGAFTFEAWISPDGWGVPSPGTLVGRIFDKTASGVSGFLFTLTSAAGLLAQVACAGTAANSSSGLDEFSPAFFGQWHHVAAQFDGTALPAGNPLIYLWIDGVPVVSYATQVAGVGAAVTDVGNDLYIGIRSDNSRTFDGRLGGWSRLSDALRYTPNGYFVPAPRTNPPGVDGNTAWQTDYSDGAGATLSDDSGNANHCTLSNYLWNVTPDMEIDCPGGRIFHGGYSIGADAANDGFTQIETGLTPGDGYLARIPITFGPGVVAWPAIRLYDEIGAAQIVQFAAPLMTGAHTGANNSATLIVAGARFTQSLVGATLDNITDGSTATVTAISGDGTTVTGILAGGVDNDWDTNDVFRFRWADSIHRHPWCEAFCFTLPAGCTSISIQARNLNNEGLFYKQQAEIIENLLQTGDMEAGAGNPYIPTGWANVGLAAGESAAEAVVIHAGAQSLRFAVAADGDGIRQQITAAVGDYVHVSMWSYGDSSAGFTIGGLDATQLLLQSSTTAFNIATLHTAVWSRTSAVFRVIAANPFIYILADAGAAGNRYIDDASAFEDNPITLTVTPANQANSLESGGIRIDGFDNAQQPIPLGFLAAQVGWIRWRGRPRHADGDYRDFEEAATPFMVWLSAPIANYITVDLSAANTIRLEVNDGAASNGVVVAPGLVVDANTLFEIRYTAAQIWFSIDGIIQITVTPGGGIDFGADIPTAAWWGSRATDDQQVDMVFISP